MKLISDYLEKYLKLTPPDDAVRSAVCEAVQNTLGVRIDKKEVVVKDGTARIQTDDSNLRSEIALHKDILLARLASVLGDKAPRDIR